MCIIESNVIFCVGVEGDLGASFLNSGVPNNPLLELTKSLELTVESAGPVQLYAPNQGKVFTAKETTHIFSEFLTVRTPCNNCFWIQIV